MTLPTIDQARSWRGMTLVATDDQPVGKIEAIYVDRTTRQPEWALVDTGLFGSSRTFVPLADAAQRGDTVQVPHELTVVREAPRLDQDAELSEEDEARLYAHYGIEYTTEASASGLPASESATAGDATTELPPSARLEADVPAATAAASATTRPTPAAGTSWSGAATGTTDTGGTGRGNGGKAAAAGAGVAALAAAAAGAVVLRRRRRKPPSLGERVGQVGRDTADAVVKAAGELRKQAAAATGGEAARKAAKGGRRARRKAARARREATESARKAALAAAAGGAAAAAKGGSKAARKAAARAAAGGAAAAQGSRRAARKAAAGAAAAAEEGRRAAKRAGSEVAQVVAAIETTPEAKLKARPPGRHGRWHRSRRRPGAGSRRATPARRHARSLPDGDGGRR